MKDLNDPRRHAPPLNINRIKPISINEWVDENGMRMRVVNGWLELLGPDLEPEILDTVKEVKEDDS